MKQTTSASTYNKACKLLLTKNISNVGKYKKVTKRAINCRLGTVADQQATGRNSSLKHTPLHCLHSPTQCLFSCISKLIESQL